MGLEIIFWIKISTNEYPHSRTIKRPKTNRQLYDDEFLFSLCRLLRGGDIFEMEFTYKQRTYAHEGEFSVSATVPAFDKGPSFLD